MDERRLVAIILMSGLMFLITSFILLLVVLICVIGIVPSYTIHTHETKYQTDAYVYPVDVELNQITQVHMNNTVKVINVTTINNPQKIDKDTINYINQILNKNVTDIVINNQSNIRQSTTRRRR